MIVIYKKLFSITMTLDVNEQNILSMGVAPVNSISAYGDHSYLHRCQWVGQLLHWHHNVRYNEHHGVSNHQQLEGLINYLFRLHWHHNVRYNERHGVSNHQQLEGLINYLFRLTSKKYQSLCYRSFVREIHQWIPLTKGRKCGKYFHCMMS